MKKIIPVLIIAFQFQLYSQTDNDTLKTYYGSTMSPIDTIYSLNIFINIHYDSLKDDPVKDSTLNWLPWPVNTINQSP